MYCYEITSQDKINWNVTDEREKKINKIANLLKTRKGELSFMRNVGVSADFTDMPITIARPRLINDIREMITEYADGVKITNIDISPGTAIGDFIIKVVVEID